MAGFFLRSLHGEIKHSAACTIAFGKDIKSLEGKVDHLSKRTEAVDEVLYKLSADVAKEMAVMKAQLQWVHESSVRKQGV